ncbi:hypothetical protein NA57DRAFT_72134 [Rhizodiscina lignyota]|uniref:VWFA domain-containing protein n=1 Tax=Rhizodiscina lignyota TaxID=1504668 RepID=A0A9P4MD65_9PEZI|nr:hypothetical protein NA57DRAFT_72134 [Rhizodiscina lignyota]
MSSITMRLIVSILLLFVTVTSAGRISGRQLLSTTPASSKQKPTKQVQCTELQAKSNDGGRKVGIVIDASGSMLENDPYDYRISASRAINSWLIPKSKASGDAKADLVTVVEFGGEADILYPLSDPAGANSAFGQIEPYGGTYIASGVQSAMDQIGNGTGTTSGRSGIIVFTDGEDDNTQELIDTINNAAAKGIRVSFGFLSLDSSYQDSGVLAAIMNSGGTFSTITDSTAQQSFVNLVIVNGLTNNDNSQGPSDVLLSGLSTGYVSKSQSSSYTYSAKKSEQLEFTITSVNASTLAVSITDSSGSSLGKATVNNDTSSSSFDYGSYGYTGTEVVDVVAEADGDLKIEITDNTDKANAMFSIGVTSDLPIQNCTLASVGPSGLSTGAKVGLGIGIPILIAGLGAGGWYLFKYIQNMPHSPFGPTGTEHQPGSPSYFDKGSNVEVNHVSGPGTPAPPGYTPNGSELQPPLNGIPPNHTGLPTHPYAPNGSEMSHPIGPNGNEFNPNHTGLPSQPQPPLNNTGVPNQPALPPNSTGLGPPGPPLQDPTPLLQPLGPGGAPVSFFIPPIVPPYAPKNKPRSGDGDGGDDDPNLHSTNSGADRRSSMPNGTSTGPGSNGPSAHNLNPTSTGNTPNSTTTGSGGPNTNHTQMHPPSHSRGPTDHFPTDPTRNPGIPPSHPPQGHDPFVLVGGARRRRSSSGSRPNPPFDFALPASAHMYNHTSGPQYNDNGWPYWQGNTGVPSPISTPAPPRSELGGVDTAVYEAPSPPQRIEMPAGGIGNRVELLTQERLGELSAEVSVHGNPGHVAYNFH